MAETGTIQPALDRFGSWTAAGLRVALVGDSTLDNVLWTSGGACVSEQLAEQLKGEGGAVCNLAADGYTTRDTLQGSRCVISVGMRRQGGDPVPFDSDGLFRPLDLLVTLDPPPSHVVISVGGNDIREILGNISQLPVAMEAFAQNYPRILERCLAITPNVVLMLQYRPSFHMDGGGYGVYQAMAKVPGPPELTAMGKLNRLLETAYGPVLALAAQHQLPIVDLPRTFDVYRDELYSHQIEPSAEGGLVIARLLAHAVREHDGKSKASTLYSCCTTPGAEAGLVREALNDGIPGSWSIPETDADREAAAASAESGGVLQKVHALVGMGFSRKAAESALQEHAGNLQAAAEALLSSAVSPP